MQAIQDYYIAPGAVVRGDVVLPPGVDAPQRHALRGCRRPWMRQGPRLRFAGPCAVQAEILSEAAESIVPQPEPPNIQLVDPLTGRRADIEAKRASVAELLQETGR